MTLTVKIINYIFDRRLFGAFKRSTQMTEQLLGEQDTSENGNVHLLSKVRLVINKPYNNKINIC